MPNIIYVLLLASIGAFLLMKSRDWINATKNLKEVFRSDKANEIASTYDNLLDNLSVNIQNLQEEIDATTNISDKKANKIKKKLTARLNRLKIQQANVELAYTDFITLKDFYKKRQKPNAEIMKCLQRYLKNKYRV